MRTVHAILMAGLLAMVLGACESKGTGFEERPDMKPREENPVDDTDREKPLPKGFVADSASHILHRADCPHVKECAPADRVFFVTPWPALNEKYAPCEYCEPLVGWK